MNGGQRTADSIATNEDRPRDSRAADPAPSPRACHAPILSSPSAVRCPPFTTASGFTLLELLVVVVIIGVIVSAATLAVGVLGGDREVEDGTRRFWAVLQQAREEAELQGLDIAVFVSQGAYEFLRFDSRRNQWVAIADDALYRPRELPEGLRYRLWLDSREVVLKPQPPDRNDEREHEKWPPQIMVLSNGDIMPFELHVERDGAPALWRVVGLPDNDLRIERRSDEREWSMVAQTKAPEEDDDRERVSSAR